MDSKKYEELKKRVQQFNSLQLPGQPFAMHIGTSNLVNDLWKELQKQYTSKSKNKIRT